MPQHVTVGIVGGGVAGLALAKMLEMLGISYILYEGYHTIAPNADASLGLMPSGLRIFDQLGVLDKIEAFSVDHDRWEHRDWESGRLYRRTSVMRNYPALYFTLSSPRRQDARLRIQARHLSPGRISDIFARREVAVMTALEEGVGEYWFCGRLFLLGDSAHKMVPHAAMGANQAMESAACFVNILRRVNPSLGKEYCSNLRASEAEKCLSSYAAKRKNTLKAVVQAATASRNNQLMAGSAAEDFLHTLPDIREEDILLKPLRSLIRAERLEDWMCGSERVEKYTEASGKALAILNSGGSLAECGLYVHLTNSIREGPRVEKEQPSPRISFCFSNLYQPSPNMNHFFYSIVNLFPLALPNPAEAALPSSTANQVRRDNPTPEEADPHSSMTTLSLLLRCPHRRKELNVYSDAGSALSYKFMIMTSCSYTDPTFRQVTEFHRNPGTKPNRLYQSVPRDTRQRSMSAASHPSTMADSTACLESLGSNNDYLNQLRERPNDDEIADERLLLFRRTLTINTTSRHCGWSSERLAFKIQHQLSEMATRTEAMVPLGKRRLLIAQDETQIFPVAAGYDDSYVDYLSGHPTNPSFMTMQQYGPFRTNLSDHMETLAQYAVGFILQISETVLDELLPTPQQKDIGASNTKMTISLRQRDK
ncbi:hypothetical protein ASPVEDRAFT_877590 [Aspergillus versicolor CBS 583.65]|uniref:FAD-binding domain-containing protein n=1 Tax=Aspergillus versicolor CBS 583.65 TaxID=1036611 RepID=A0A1L9Q1D7_ASPVE|nr:uncharacterized protein ASPVEDRAFT_877590 [Aspergillus versicolor CBS 583.65]OJJ07597.1 hypothetical protein ASPVEDRAFT_877590 [Aspergillus versicolor CBS 583.65]